MSASVRFTQIIASAGKPSVHVLWGSAASDPEFQRALKGQRLMTVHQENVGSKKDYGLVGFSPETPSQFLIFPRSLQAYSGKRVVGINYEVIDPLPPKVASARERAAGPVRQKKDKAKKARSLEKLDPPEPPAPKPVAPQRRPPKPTRSPTPAAAPAGDGSIQEVETPAVAPVTPPPPKRTGLDRPAVLKEVIRAMKELEAGKAVLVFRRLEQLAKQLKAD